MRLNPISSWDRSISNTLLYGCTTAYLSIHTMKNTWLVPSFWPSQTQLPWIFMYGFLCEHGFHFSSINAHKGVWLLSCKVSEYLSLCGTPKLSSRMTVPFSHQKCMSDPLYLHHCQNLVSSIFFILAFKQDVDWYLTVALICISLMVNDVEHLFTCLFTWLFP